MSFHTWIAFVIAGALIAISPGSGAVLSMSHGLAYGVKKASATVWGLQLGLMLVLIVAGAGVGSLLLASPVAFTVVKVCGALYLVYLGLAQWRSAASSHGLTTSTEHAASVPSLRRRLLTGFLTNTTNPKGIIFMVAVLPQFIAKQAPLLPQLAILAVTMITIDAIVMHGYATLAASMQHFLRNPRAMRMLNRLFGAVLMIMGALLLLVERQGA